MTWVDDRISGLEDRLRQLKARHSQIEARGRALSVQQARKDDTRRKILVGAIVLAKVEHGALPESDLRGWLDAGLSRDDDRKLFGLSSDEQPH